MAQLKVVITKNLVETVPLLGPVLIGRGEDSHIPLLDAAVSRRHAELTPDGADWLITDLGSANGSFVNDEQIDAVTLTDGDVIRIGGKVLVYTAEVAGPITGAALDWTGGAPDPAAVASALDADVVRFRFPSIERLIEEAVEPLRTVVSRGPLNPSEADALVTATREALTNSIMHGNSGDPDKSALLRVSVDADKVRCTIEDQGPGFDYRHALEAGRTRHAMDLARERYESGGVGGLGIMLMLRSVDLVEYNAQGNIVTLTKWRGDFYRDETIYGSLGLFAENDEPSSTPTTSGEPASPRHQTVQFEPATGTTTVPGTPPTLPDSIAAEPFDTETLGLEIESPGPPSDPAPDPAPDLAPDLDD